jgi:hypothetical protein
MGSSVASFAGSALGGLGGLISGGKAADAYKGQAEALRAAGLRSSQMAQFRPIGLTTGFGTSNFRVNDLGQVEEAGYQLTPQLQAIRDRLLTSAGGYDPTQLGQAAQPLMGGAASLFNLGQQYLAQSPQEAAQQYISQQQALLAPSREAQLSGVRSNLFARGRGGLGVQAGTGGAPTSPELQAYYNSLARQDLELAARGQQAGMEQVRFGAGLFGTGGEILGQVPRLTSAGYGPLETQLGLARTVESLGQQPFAMSQELARLQAGAGASAGNLYLQPQTAAANAYSQYQGYSPLGTALSGLGSSMSGGGFSGLLSNIGIGGSGLNPYNRYGSGMFDLGRAPTGSTGFESWESPYIS